jgi:hypothetical protein
MNCSLVRALLPLSLTGDLKPEEAASVDEHLTTCPACRRERAELEKIRAALSAVPVPAVQIDLPGIYRQAAERQARRARRWRRAALACCGVAAALLMVIGLRLEVRVGGNELIVRWGAPPPENPRPQPKQDSSPPAQVKDRPAPQVPDADERLRLMNELIHALTTDIEARDVHQQQRLARLQERLDRLSDQASRWRLETERDVAALYTAQFVKKGE